ncbi:HEPN domain-containing protein [Facklamia sp. P12955]|uniref:HEPN domain-containing protein n=1 Tax=unclassified Facklamia TaxID=2622293 RepID=UPI003D17B5AD
MYIWETNLEICKIVNQLDKDIEGEQLTPSKIEGLNRIAVHSGYYACLNKIRQLNNLKGFETVKGGLGSHTEIIDCLNKYEDLPDKNEIMRTMRKLKEYRKKADYEDGNSNLFSRDPVDRIIKTCEKTFNTLNKL